MCIDMWVLGSAKALECKNHSCVLIPIRGAILFIHKHFVEDCKIMDALNAPDD